MRVRTIALVAVGVIAARRLARCARSTDVDVTTLRDPDWYDDVLNVDEGIERTNGSHGSVPSESFVVNGR